MSEATFSLRRTRAAQWPQCRRFRRQAGLVFRIWMVVWLVIQIVYTPIHLYCEPHSEDADFAAASSAAPAVAKLADESHDGDEHHERHPAAQHKFKVVNCERVVLVEITLVPAVQWLDTGGDRFQPQVIGFPGLSPPELAPCWQFYFRAALPIRAPPILS